MKKSYIIHHTDNDGLCAAAIVANYLVNPFEQITAHPEKFIPFNYNPSEKLMDSLIDLDEDTTIYIVDLSICDEILNVINNGIDKGCNIIHIDHHTSSLEWKKEIIENGNDILNKYIHFYNDKFSGCLLTYVYTHFNDEQKLHPEDVEWDVSSGYEGETDKLHPLNFAMRFMIFDGSNQEYKIPAGVRYIDDNDIWRHALTYTKPFREGFYGYGSNENMLFVEAYHELHPEMDVKEIKETTRNHPCSSVWTTILGDDFRYIQQILTRGETILSANRNRYSVINRNIFYAEMIRNNGETVKLCCLNNPSDNSDCFLDEYDKNDICCKFHMMENGIKVTLYSGKTDKVNCAEICAEFGGGGHKGAAGCFITWDKIPMLMNKFKIVSK